jgi:hypothetical protein
MDMRSDRHHNTHFGTGHLGLGDFPSPFIHKSYGNIR